MSQRSNSLGRTYDTRKATGSDLRSLIIEHLKKSDADVELRYLLRGLISHTSSFFKVSRTLVKKIWEGYCVSGSVKPLPHSGGKTDILNKQDLEYVYFLKKERPSLSLTEIKEKINDNCGKDVSLSTISRAINVKLNEGKWSYNVLSAPAAERFSDYNINYLDAYVQEIRTKDQYKLKSVALNRKRGHSPIGLQAIETQISKQESNSTLNLLLGLSGVVCADFIYGASNSAEFMRFFHEAAISYSDDGKPYIEPCDTVVVDNASIHRFDAERALGIYFAGIGVEYIFLPTYSADMNPVEHAFNYIRTKLRNEFADMAYAILEIANSIDVECITGFYRSV